MSVDTFERAYAVMLPFELGYVNNPLDPGGATKDGVTQATYSEWRDAEALAERSVKLMTDDERRRIYFSRYWIGPSSPSVLANAHMPLLAICDFDWCVNAGPQRGAYYVQASVRTNPDGVWGPRTLAALDVAKDAPTAATFLVLRAHHYRARCGSQDSLQALADAGLSKVAPKPRPDQVVFLKGWLRRLRLLATQLALPIDPLFAKGADTLSLPHAA